MPTRRSSLAALLAGPDRRSIGRANAVAAAVLRSPRRAGELVRALSGDDPALRMRAADALEKVCREAPGVVQPHVTALLRLAHGTSQPEVQWHLAQLLRQLVLRLRQQRAVAVLMRAYLQSSSAIVRTEALTTLAALAKVEPRLKGSVRREVRRRLTAGTPAERARARKLVAAWDG